MKPLALLLAQLLAFWPVGHWVYLRVRYDVDQPWEFLALGVAAAFVVRVAIQRGSDGSGTGSGSVLVGPALALLVYAAVQASLPELGRAVLAVTILAYTTATLVTGRRDFVALWGLLLLGLPLIPVLQFHLGYPLRTASAALAAPLLGLSGLEVEPVGTCLRWSGELVWVDAPCSGIRMLWSGLLMAFGLACFLRLGNARTLLAAGLAFALLIVANAARTAALFQLEIGLVDLPAWGHEAIGLAVQAAAVGSVLWIVMRLEEPPCAAPRST